MHLPIALIAGLSLATASTQAVPVRHGHGHGTGSTKLMVRSVPEDAIQQHSGPIEAVIKMPKSVQSRSLLRRSDVASLRARDHSLAVVRDLQARGLLDTLVAALRDLVIELLGAGGQARRGLDADLLARQAEGGIPTQVDAVLHSIECLLSQLFGNNDPSCKEDTNTGSGNSTEPTAPAPTGKSQKSSGRMTEVVTNNGTKNGTESTSNTNSKGESNSNSDVTSSLADEISNAIQSLQSRQAPSGVEGLLEVLRELLDAILTPFSR